MKLSESPTPNELIKQIQIMNEKWDYIVGTSKNLHIRLERKQLTLNNLILQSNSCKNNSGDSHYKGMPAKMLPSFSNIRH